jgi:30S ribosomal protein S31
MGKGDKKTKRGKIFAGSFGKVRPKPKKERKHKAPAEAAETKATRKKPAKKKEPKADG